LVLELDKVSDLLKTQFLGAGKYKIEITAANYVLAEEVVSNIEALLEKTTDIDSVFERD